MGLGLTRQLMLRLAKAGADERRRIIGSLTAADLLRLDCDFDAWAQDAQLPPAGESWRVWLMMAGRGFGKTRAGAEWVHRLASGRRPLRIAIVGANMAETRSIMVEGVSGILSVAGRNQKAVKWEPSLNRLSWRGGSQAQLFSGESPEALRGPQHHVAWCDELAKWTKADDTWNNLQMGLRAGARPRALVTTTPRPLPLLGRIESDRWTVKTGGRTKDNVNLPEAFIDVMTATYAGTRLGRQELDGEMIADVEGALWPRELIERCRMPPAASGGGLDEFGEELERVVIGVDPPAGVGEGVDACGIVVVGCLGERLYVLADESVQGLRPEGWSNRVAAAAARWKAGTVVAEANNGGAMVASVLRAADSGLKVRLVHASRGKCARAEPIALRFEAGKAFFAGEFPELEDQLAGLIAGGGYQGPGRSPDRADAMVWAMTVLTETRSGLPRVRRL